MRLSITKCTNIFFQLPHPVFSYKLINPHLYMSPKHHVKCSISVNMRVNNFLLSPFLYFKSKILWYFVVFYLFFRNTKLFLNFENFIKLFNSKKCNTVMFSINISLSYVNSYINCSSINQTRSKFDMFLKKYMRKYFRYFIV